MLKLLYIPVIVLTISRRRLSLMFIVSLCSGVWCELTV